MSNHPGKASGASQETINFRIAELINKEISQPVCLVATTMVLAGKNENEVMEAAGITARVILQTLKDHLLR